MENQNCIICKNNFNNKVYAIKELQLGLNDEFNYQLCNACGSMQLMNPPNNFERYYPNDDYYSFNFQLKNKKNLDAIRKIKASYFLYNKNKMLGSLFSLGYKKPDYYFWMRQTKANLADAILDVGCGNGGLLTKLASIGFTNLTGIDPFIKEDTKLGIVKLLKKDITTLSDKFDVIMMHHSLEHMFAPLDKMKKANEILNVGGRLLIRIPIMGNYGWKKYGVNWCGIDAPRHIFIPSEKGMKQLCKESGFVINKIEYDSSDYVIWSSEQYLKGIPLHAKSSRAINKKNDTFSLNQIKEYKKIIATENLNNNGDTVAFYLEKI